MRYVSDVTYKDYAQALYEDNMDVLNQTIFASTEDPTALQYFIDNMAPWMVHYTRVSRNNHGGRSVSGWYGVANSAASAHLLASA
jgi:hypothetical protein